MTAIKTSSANHVSSPKAGTALLRGYQWQDTSAVLQGESIG